MKCRNCPETADLYLVSGKLYCLWCLPTDTLPLQQWVIIARERARLTKDKVVTDRLRRHPARGRECALCNESRNHPENSSNRSDGIPSAA
jgi:hypothetical protein